jgi:hypothetical protein
VVKWWCESTEVFKGRGRGGSSTGCVYQGCGPYPGRARTGGVQRYTGLSLGKENDTEVRNRHESFQASHEWRTPQPQACRALPHSQCGGAGRIQEAVDSRGLPRGTLRRVWAWSRVVRQATGATTRPPQRFKQRLAAGEYQAALPKLPLADGYVHFQESRVSGGQADSRRRQRSRKPPSVTTFRVRPPSLPPVRS